MALVLKDRVRETSTTTGTGTFTLAGAVAGFQSFSAIGTGNSTYYTIVATSDWEVGIGTWTTPNQLSRDTVLASTNAGALVTFGSGTKDVFLTFPAEGFAVPPAIGGTTPNTITGTVITAKDGGASAFVIDDSNSTGVTCTFNVDQATYCPVISATDGSTNYPLQLDTGLYVRNGSWLQLSNTGNSSIVYIKAPTSFTTYYLTLPTTAGSNNQVLKTDGTGVLSWTTVDPLTLTGISDPTAPSNTNTTIYSKSFGGNVTLAARNALNASFGLQSALWSKNIHMWTCTNSTAGSWLNSAGASAGTFTAVTPTAGSTLYQTIRRSTYANVITNTNQVLGVNSNYLSFFRGSVASQGGFFFYTRCGFDVWTNGGRFFAGLATNNTTIISANPSALNNTVGFCVDSGDNGAISFLTRGTAATKASTGYTIVSNKGYDLYFYAAPNASTISWMIVDINAGTSASGTANTNLPTNTQTLQPEVLASNAALTPATSISLGIAKIYVESDY